MLQQFLVYNHSCNNFYSPQNKNYYEQNQSYHMVKLTDTVSSGSVNVSSYPGYQNFTVDNFVFRNLTKGSMSDYSRAAKYQYDPNTGIFTFQHGGGWCYWDGPYISACGAAETWLIY